MKEYARLDILHVGPLWVKVRQEGEDFYLSRRAFVEDDDSLEWSLGLGGTFLIETEYLLEEHRNDDN